MNTLAGGNKGQDASDRSRAFHVSELFDGTPHALEWVTVRFRLERQAIAAVLYVPETTWQEIVPDRIGRETSVRIP